MKYYCEACDELIEGAEYFNEDGELCCIDCIMVENMCEEPDLES